MKKALNKEMKKILAERLENLIEEKKDTDYTLSIPKQCKQMDIPLQTFYKYKNAESDCSITYLSIIADYYGVSTDYLLGRTNAKSPNSKIQAVCNTVGLSDKAVKKLMDIKENNDTTGYSDILSVSIEDISFENYLALISTYILSFAEKQGLNENQLIMALAKNTEKISVNGFDYRMDRNELIKSLIQNQIATDLDAISEFYLKSFKIRSEK